MAGSAHEVAFDVFSAFPEGLTAFEFVELMERKEDKRCASARLSQFVREGLARKGEARLNVDTGQMATVYVPTGEPFRNRVMEERDPGRKRKRPTSSELLELRRWKAEAIKRFPELGIDPVILAARSQVSRILREEGNGAKAAMIERGELDDGETMRIVLSVMKGQR